MKILPKILFYYSAAASIFITVSLVSSSQTLIPVLFTTLYLPVTAYFVIEFFKELRSPLSKDASNNKVPIPKITKGEAIPLILFFLLLVGIGVFKVSSVKTVPEISPTPYIVKVSEQKSTPTPTSTPTTSLVVSIEDGSDSINIRKEPTIYSDKVGEAKNGDEFFYTEKANGWYLIKFASGSAGYVSSKYAKEITK